MMKKLFGVCLSAVLVMVSITGCGTGDAAKTTESTDPIRTETGEETAAASSETSDNSQ